MEWKLTAWVKNTPNAVPIATAEFRSTTLMRATQKLWVKSFDTEIEALPRKEKEDAHGIS